MEEKKRYEVYGGFNVTIEAASEEEATETFTSGDFSLEDVTFDVVGLDECNENK